MNYTEDELVTLLYHLAEKIDDEYRSVTKDNDRGYNLVFNNREAILDGSFFKPSEPEATVPLTFLYLERKLGWIKFCELTGVNEYAKNEGYEFSDTEIFYIPESKVEEYNLI